MIKLVREGAYRLIETKGQTKVLTLGRGTFAWVYAEGIGEILVTSHRAHKEDHVLATGEYRLYEVQDEPNLTDLEHLELSVGGGAWQGYLLLTGLPSEKNKRSRIIPTKEIIAGS